MRILSRIFGYVCMVVLSVISATFAYMIVFTPPDFGFGYFQVTSLFIFVAYFIFATPIQLFLHRKPQKFNIRYLLVYFLSAFIVCSVLALLTDYGLIVFVRYELYVFSFLLALIYWFWDSVFLQKKRL
ncbi:MULTISPECIES: UPF0715 family protein [Bacillus subtilis group]|jgi:hypothetical protein|uniref:Uncharacterized protein n=2 Tax=Bacillus subtilis group TaxID=653685 RepID=D5LKV2_BACAM|nr:MULTISPECIES: UPF0715 family protein [Bacteria]ADF30856.1 hypothetical protein [Bacillus amyloliquefaciens]AIU83990.1 hypothetical protein NG74_p00003 [Bacillus velezensis]ASK60699.1 hypothetical protein CFN60_19885 [Bacillus velezensis]ATV25062.1 hypothetical protein CS547_19970 [Bacillus sp. Lzh-5]KAA0068232.1 hypothetical protein CIW53_17435 [Rhodanobacter sp. T12-5]